MTEEKSKTPKTDLLDWRVAYKDTQETKELVAKARYLCSLLEGKWNTGLTKINLLKTALEEIAGGIRIPKRPGGGAQICLSALDMQKIANDALTEINQ